MLALIFIAAHFSSLLVAMPFYAAVSLLPLDFALRYFHCIHGFRRCYAFAADDYFAFLLSVFRLMLLDLLLPCLIFSPCR